jgi:WXG100 family type VII secretion target
MMSHDEIKLNYELAEEMIRTFNDSYEQLQDTTTEMLSISNILEEGALLGRGGTAFTDAIRSNLCPSLGRLTDKFQELAKDVQSAINAMQEADAASSRMFKD